MTVIRLLERLEMRLSEKPPPLVLSGPPPVRSWVEDCALLVGAVQGGEEFDNTFTFDIMSFRQLQYERRKQVGDDEITIVNVKRETDRRIEKVSLDNGQSAIRWLGETGMPEGLLLYQGSAISK